MLSEQQRKVIEHVGVCQEQKGYSPVSSRIMGLLLVADREVFTFEDIMQELNISKSATSNALNLLMSLKKVEYITMPGDRKRYFKARDFEIEEIFEEFYTDLVDLNVMFKEIYSSKKDKSTKSAVRMNAIISFIDFIESKLPILVKEWRELSKI